MTRKERRLEDFEPPPAVELSSIASPRLTLDKAAVAL